MSECNATQVSFSTFKISLNGPFILELHKNLSNPHQINALTAVVPHNPKPMGKNHLLYLDGVKKGEDDGSQMFEFRLVKTNNPAATYGVELCPSPRFVDPAFYEFRFTGHCTHQRFFVKLHLPCPDRIVFTRGPVPVVFEADEHVGYMPLNQVLEYEIHHPNQGIGLTSAQLGTKMLDQYNDSFLLEVGLEKDTDPDNEHALFFYNEVLLHCLPDPKPKRLESILGTDPSTMRIVTGDVECKIGGGMSG